MDSCVVLAVFPRLDSVLMKKIFNVATYNDIGDNSLFSTLWQQFGESLRSSHVELMDEILKFPVFKTCVTYGCMIAAV